MSDLNRILEQLLKSGAATGFAGGLAGGLASSVLTGKVGRKSGKKVLKYGGIAAIGTMAYSAYKNYQRDSAGTEPWGSQPPMAMKSELPPPESGFLPRAGDHAGQSALGLTLVRAMIAAGRADGRLDSDESQAIFGRIQDLDLPPEDKSLLVSEMEHPVDMDDLVKSANTQEVATEIYTASLLAIELDDNAESAYLAMLAARLRLPAELVSEIHREVLSR